MAEIDKLSSVLCSIIFLSLPTLLPSSLLAQVSSFNLSQFHLFKWLIPVLLSLCSKSCSPLWSCSAHLKVLAHSVPISTVPKSNEKYLSLFKLKPIRHRCHREEKVRQFELPDWPSMACPRLTLYCSESSACPGLGMARANRIFRGVYCYSLNSHKIYANGYFTWQNVHGFS